MAQFGDLDEFLNDSDISFTWNGETHDITVPADKVMRFNVEHAKHQAAESARLNRAMELRKEGKPVEEAGEVDQWAEYVMVAKLLGGTFDRKALRFKDCLLADLQDAGAPQSAINRLVIGIVMKFIHGDLAAEHYMTTGDMREAIMQFSGKGRPSRATRDKQETQKDTGETSGEGSETQQG